jgi:thiamine kinase-like enzyme
VLEHRSSLAKRVCSAGESFVTHNDVTEDGSNILVPKDGDVVIFDWEGSTLSVPGADLGLLTQVASGERLMTVYVEEMADKGIDLDLDRIRFTAEVVWGFRLLQGAWRRCKPHQAELALSMLRRHTSGS